jgi:hypothetical protein
MDEKVTFDPNKPYQWKPTDIFEFNGVEYSLLANALRTLLNSEEAQKVMMYQDMYKLVEQKLKDAVETGKAVELVQPPDEPQQSN